MTLRAERIGETIRSILAVELLELTDPRLEMVTVTGVDVTPDLSHASVWFDVLGGEEARIGAQRALDGATRRLQQVVARGLHARRTPKLTFAPDHGIAAGERLDATLRELRSAGILADASAEAESVADASAEAESIADASAEAESIADAADEADAADDTDV